MSDNRPKNKKTDLDLCVFYTFLVILLVTVDQFIKKVIDTEMEYNSIKQIIPKFFSLHYVRNTGSAFSLFADKEWGIYFLSGMSIVLGIAIFVLMIVAASKSMKLISFAFCLLASGAIGNLIDRIWLKYVIDYLRFDFGTYTFPIFNFADICAVVGTVLLICIIIFGSKYFESFWHIIFKKKEKKQDKAEEDDEEENIEIEEAEEAEEIEAIELSEEEEKEDSDADPE
ncbi:MAG: signal peptidase II [Clostridiales bacterium]|nr:signal peptidase II [Clostridiales bacterium]MBR6986727.1 signal peptidase II [Clostridiales bacterium]